MPTQRGGNGQSGARRLIAALRVSAHDEALLAVVRPYLADAGSESEVAYRLWRRGLEVTLGEVVGLGATVPSGVTEELIAALVAQRLLLCLPLLRRTGTLEHLGLAANVQAVTTSAFTGSPVTGTQAQAIDQNAADAIADLGATDFL